MELFKIKYKEEAIELIEAMEKSLLLMESNFDDPALIEEVFRNMHNLKGNSSMFGFKIYKSKSLVLAVLSPFKYLCALTPKA